MKAISKSTMKAAATATAAVVAVLKKMKTYKAPRLFQSKASTLLIIQACPMKKYKLSRTSLTTMRKSFTTDHQ